MSSIAIIQKSKLTPLNLTNETVFQIMREAPTKVPSSKKMYPTVKYATEEVRSAAEINTKIIKKIKQLQRVNSQQKRPRVRIELCKTEASNHNYFNKNYLRAQLSKNSVQFKNNQERGDLFGLQKQKQKGKQTDRDSPQKSEAQNYYDKISRIKNMKLRLYMKSKFAIDVKTIETARNNQKTNNGSQHQKRSGESLHLNFPKRMLLCRHSKSQYQQKLKNILTTSEQIQNIQEAEREQLQISGEHFTEEKNSQSKQIKNINGVELKLTKIMKKTQKLDKTQLLQKKFGFTREFEDHPADGRFQRMINQLDLILYSFSTTYAIKKPLPTYNKNCDKFKYFVGAGNNKNLIVSLMKKRWWWSQTHSMSQAHFVWTQIKQQKVLQNCPKTQISKQFIDNSTKIEKDKLIQQHSSSITKLKSKQLNVKNRLFHPNLIIKYDEQTYQRSQTSKQLKSLQIPKKIHNHYCGNSVLGNKKALFHYLSQYCQYKNINRYDYIPQTFHITHKNSSQMQKLQHSLKEVHSNSYWILKPGENSNRGNGISVTKSIQKIQQKVRNLGGGTLIVQKYIDNLFLYKHRKFDIRTYMIAVTISGSTKFYWHSQGYLRTSSFIYSMKDHDNIFVHLTNDAIQSTNQNYGKHQQGNKLSYQQFQRYLDKNYHNKGYSIKQAHEQMRDIAKIAVRATYPQLNSSKLEYSFEVFGLDFIIDSNFKPWLIQVNTNPCLELSSSTLQRLIPQMIENTLRLALDSVFQPCVEFPRSMSSCVPDNIFASNRFSVIFDDLFDREPQWEKVLTERMTGMSKGDEDEEEEQFEGDGEIIDNI